MLDVVANHVAPVDLDYSQVTPFNSTDYYHSKCQISNWNDPGNVEYCRLANLPDLNQDNTFVRETLKTWVKDTVAKFGFDGIRVDTVPEVKKDFWDEYREAAGVYQVGEVFNGDIGYVSSFQGHLDATLNYPLYFAIKSVWDYKQSMFTLRTTKQQEAASFQDTSVLGNFIDNHDNVRFLNANDNWELLKGALAFNLFNEGIPIVYYGTEQGFNGGNDPFNRAPLWTSKFN
jgi:alpha-amylase